MTWQAEVNVSDFITFTRFEEKAPPTALFNSVVEVMLHRKHVNDCAIDLRQQCFTHLMHICHSDMQLTSLIFLFWWFFLSDKTCVAVWCDLLSEENLSVHGEEIFSHCKTNWCVGDNGFSWTLCFHNLYSDYKAIHLMW